MYMYTYYMQHGDFGAKYSFSIIATNVLALLKTPT